MSWDQHPEPFRNVAVTSRATAETGPNNRTGSSVDVEGPLQSFLQERDHTNKERKSGQREMRRLKSAGNHLAKFS